MASADVPHLTARLGIWTAAVRLGYAGIAPLPERSPSPQLSRPAHLVATPALGTIPHHRPEVGVLVVRSCELP